MNYKVESEFEHEGLKCVVIFGRHGNRCGYVGVTKDHPEYGKDYSDVEGDYEVHGGLTYAGGGENSTYPINSDLWWFGYDCAHYMDGQDIEQAFKYGILDQKTFDIMKTMQIYRSVEDEVRSLEYCENECKYLAKQLAERLTA